MANITLKYAILSVAAKSEVAVTKKPDMANLCVGQPDKDEHDPTPLKAPKVCDTCGPITDNDVLKKGIKAGSAYTVVDQEDIAEAKAEFTKQYLKVIEVVPHPAADFLAKTAPGDSVYYLTPADAAGADHYQLMVKLVTEHPELVFAGLHTPRSATSLYALSVRDGVLVMEKRSYSQALKPAPSVGGSVNDAFYSMLEGSLAMFTTPYDPDTYEDAYANALAKMVEEGETVSIDGKGKPAAKVKVEPDDVLMEKLRVLQAVA